MVPKLRSERCALKHSQSTYCLAATFDFKAGAVTVPAAREIL